MRGLVSIGILCGLVLALALGALIPFADGKGLTVSSPFHVDGEPVRADGPLTVRVRPGALLVAAPGIG